MDNTSGTQYVKEGNSIIKPYQDIKTPTKTICECLYCGDRFGSNAAGGCSIYCSNCKTADKRKELDIENNLIKDENIEKGYKYSN